MKTKDNREIMLVALQDDDREQFVLDNQEAFKYGATQEFGMRDNHFEEEGEIISRETIIHAISREHAEAYRIVCEGGKVGGVVISVEPGQCKGELELLFVSPQAHSKGIGYAAWMAVEELHPEVNVWETVTPYFETRNIHFYVNRCGFHIVEFFNSYHQDPNDPEMMQQPPLSGEDKHEGMFRFQKKIERGYCFIIT